MKSCLCDSVWFKNTLHFKSKPGPTDRRNLVLPSVLQFYTAYQSPSSSAGYLDAHRCRLCSAGGRCTNGVRPRASRICFMVYVVYL